MAYDFQLHVETEEADKLLWETRFSVNEKHNAFDKALPFAWRRMLQSISGSPPTEF